MTATTTVNGQSCNLARITTVATLVSQWCPSPRGVAVAINGEVVPRSTWEHAEVAPGDAVEIVSAAAGG
jgi:sulfur carrier protein